MILIIQKLENISLINIGDMDSSENNYPNITNLCYGDTQSKTNSWNTLCSNMNYNNINNSIQDAFIYTDTSSNDESDIEKNILCAAKEGIDYICPGVDEYTPDPSKTFCQE